MPFMSFFIDVRSCSCCWECSANHVTRSSMLERNNFSRWEIEHFFEIPLQWYGSNISQKKSGCRQWWSFISNKKYGRWRLPEIISFFNTYMWHSSHSDSEIEILKPVFFLRTPPARFFSTLPMSYPNSKESGSQKTCFPSRWSSQLNWKNIRSKNDHLSIWIITNRQRSGGTKSLKAPPMPPLTSRHTFSEV